MSKFFRSSKRLTNLENADNLEENSSSPPVFRRSLSYTDFAKYCLSGTKSHKYYVPPSEDNRKVSFCGLQLIEEKPKTPQRKRKSLVQRILPTQFSNDSDKDSNLPPQSIDPTVIQLNVYRINDQLGFYHTGIVVNYEEYTYCQDIGIYKHLPRDVEFATYLGTITLGCLKIGRKKFDNLLNDMKETGFASKDYDVMQNSCNTFTEELSRRLGILKRYPTGVLTQSKLGGFFSPLARALDLVPDHMEENPTTPPSRRLLRIKSSMSGSKFD